MKIILASQSPRRKEILLNAGYNIEVIPSEYDEKINGVKYSTQAVEACAYHKAADVLEKADNSDVIVAADTVVVLNDTIIGKPKSEQEALKMLMDLSDKTHFVATSICIISKGSIIKATDKTYVTFRKLSVNEILNYIRTKNLLDKAGSYGIQDEGFDFSTQVVGSLNNVIGFPLELFEELIKSI